MAQSSENEMDVAWKYMLETKYKKTGSGDYMCFVDGWVACQNAMLNTKESVNASHCKPLSSSEASPKLPSFEESWNALGVDECDNGYQEMYEACEQLYNNLIKKLGNFT